jgi:hypothetical protein
MPALGSQLDAGAAALQWTLNGYLLVLASLILIGGALGDRFGRRRMLVAGAAEELLEELEDAAGHLHDAAEEWAEDWEKPNQVTRIRREYAAGKADVGRLAGEVAALAGSHPLGGTASATLAEIRRRASALP